MPATVVSDDVWHEIIDQYFAKSMNECMTKDAVRLSGVCKGWKV
jgi:hypothetical protein